MGKICKDLADGILKTAIKEINIPASESGLSADLSIPSYKVNLIVDSVLKIVNWEAVVNDAVRLFVLVAHRFSHSCDGDIDVTNIKSEKMEKLDDFRKMAHYFLGCVNREYGRNL
jgi:hypothetical protein